MAAAEAMLIAGNVFILLVIIFVVGRPLVIVVEKETAVIVERWGKYKELLREGIHFFVPIMDRVRPITWREMEVGTSGKMIETKPARIDLRERIMDFPQQSVITRDNVEIQVHPMILYKIVDPVRVAYEIYDLSYAVEKLVQCNLRSIIGDMGLDDTLASREEINKILTHNIASTLLNWGCELTRVELLEINPASASIENAMHQQLQAERRRRAAVKQAEGQRIKVKTHAEGNMTAVIARSRGRMEVTKILAKADSDAKVLVASAEAQALKLVGAEMKEFGVDPSDYLVGLKYLEAFEKIASGAQKRTMFMPYMMDVAGAVSVFSKS